MCEPQLAEVLEVLDAERVAGQVQQRIQQHRAVAVRQHEAVAVGPAADCRDCGSGGRTTAPRRCRPCPSACRDDRSWPSGPRPCSAHGWRWRAAGGWASVRLVGKPRILAGAAAGHPICPLARSRVYRNADPRRLRASLAAILARQYGPGNADRCQTSYLFTSESVSEGHPDKVADQISDAVLDAILAQDKRARVACETLVKTGVAIVAGEVTTEAWVDLEEIVRDVITDIGYTSRRRLRRPHLRRAEHHRQAVARHRHGRRPRQARGSGRGRPGPDVRLREQRDRRR